MKKAPLFILVGLFTAVLILSIWQCDSYNGKALDAKAQLEAADVRLAKEPTVRVELPKTERTTQRRRFFK
jgi:hypothetical protein